MEPEVQFREVPVCRVNSCTCINPLANYRSRRARENYIPYQFVAGTYVPYMVLHKRFFSVFED